MIRFTAFGAIQSKPDKKLNEQRNGNGKETNIRNRQQCTLPTIS